MTVVPFTRPEPMFFVCNCGCSSFFLRDDGEAICTSCDCVMNGVGQGWYDRVTSMLPRPANLPPVEYSNVGSIAQAMTAKRAGEADVALIVVAKSGGGLHVFSDLLHSEGGTQEQLDWLFRRLDQAKEMIVPGTPPDA